jgi:hypothetical protein
MTRRIPDAVFAHARAILLPRPGECPHCRANGAALQDDGAGHLNCQMCGWELLYVRSEAWPPAHILIQIKRRGRGSVRDGPRPAN